MKALQLIAIFCFITSAKVFAQTPQAIEADLLKSFKKIDYWDQQQTKGANNAGDSLDTANDAFGNKLKRYTENYPSTISQPFNLLKKESLDICTSVDGLFRIYSWDTEGGGTMRQFANVFQYKVSGGDRSSLLINSENLEIPYYSNLYTFKNNTDTYYLGIYGIIESSRYAGIGIKIFAIEKGKLNDDVKIIKTQSGLHSKIFYEYDFGSVVDIPFEKRPTITFDQTSQTIRIPLVDGKGQVTKKIISYKFNGQYFEKIKS